MLIHQQMYDVFKVPDTLLSPHCDRDFFFRGSLKAIEELLGCQQPALDRIVRETSSYRSERHRDLGLKQSCVLMHTPKFGTRQAFAVFQSNTWLQTDKHQEDSQAF